MRFFREPLVHFLLLGAVIFVFYGLVSEGGGGKGGHIVVTNGKIANLAAMFARIWQRPPTEPELEGLIQDYIREEVLYREALVLGLDRDDIVIRRRLRQKMEFISEDFTPPVEPSDEELRAYLQAHAKAFAIEPRFTFRQVYLDPQRRGAHLARDVDQLLAELQQAHGDADPAALSDGLLLEHAFESISATDVRRMFGETFVAGLLALTSGQWLGPVPSGYGVHLVYVSGRTEGRVPELAEVRDVVRREWTNAQRVEAHEAFYQRLHQRYTVTIERSPFAGAKRNVAEVRP